MIYIDRRNTGKEKCIWKKRVMAWWQKHVVVWWQKCVMAWWQKYIWWEMLIIVLILAVGILVFLFSVDRLYLSRTLCDLYSCGFTKETPGRV